MRHKHGDTKRADAKQGGAAIMELAVLLPLLLVTTIGLVDFGRAAYEAIEVENAAHAGASFGARNTGAAGDITGIREAALADMGDEVDTSAVNVDSEARCECADGSSIDCTQKCGAATPLMYVRVSVEKQFQTLLEYPGMASTIDLVREVELRVR